MDQIQHLIDDIPINVDIETIYQELMDSTNFPVDPPKVEVCQEQRRAA